MACEFKEFEPGLLIITHNKWFVSFTIKWEPCLASQKDLSSFGACLTLDELQVQRSVTNDDFEKQKQIKKKSPSSWSNTAFWTPLNCLSCTRAELLREPLNVHIQKQLAVVLCLDQESLKVNCFLDGPAQPLYWTVWSTLWPQHTNSWPLM